MGTDSRNTPEFKGETRMKTRKLSAPTAPLCMASHFMHCVFEEGTQLSELMVRKLHVHGHMVTEATTKRY